MTLNTFTLVLLCFAIFNCQAKFLTVGEACEFKDESGQCFVVTEKPKPDNKDIYCREYYEVSGKPAGPLEFKEGKHPALPMEFPHMVAIGIPNKNNEKIIDWSCGGTLISKQHVLTTAKCLRNAHIGEAKFVRLGDANIRDDKIGPFRQDFNIEEIYIHPDFKSLVRYHDVGIAKLNRPVDISPYVVPACLNAKPEIPLKELYSATGWGKSKKMDWPNSTLQKVILNIVENKDCRKKLKRISNRKLPNGIDDSLYICVGAPNTSTCQGDSGGPLQQINENGVSIVYGIISFGPLACEEGNLPEVHTRVSKYVDWIKSVIE